jgi:hypothetical protein
MLSKNVIWIGASGVKYRYLSKPLPYRPSPDQPVQDGNYVLAKMAGGVWVPLYFGQGRLDEGINDDDHCRCAVAKGATHVHVYSQARSAGADRLVQNADLLAGYPTAYAPTGCNDPVEA